MRKIGPTKERSSEQATLVLGWRQDVNPGIWFPACALTQKWQTFTVKSQMVNLLGFAGRRVCAAPRLCRAAVDNTEMNKHACIPVKLYLRTLKSEFHKIFALQIILLLIAFNYLKSEKIILSSRSCESGQLSCLMACKLLYGTCLNSELSRPSVHSLSFP